MSYNTATVILCSHKMYGLAINTNEHNIYEHTPVDLDERHIVVGRDLSHSLTHILVFIKIHTPLPSLESTAWPRHLCALKHADLSVDVFKWVGIYLGGCLCC